MKVALAQMNSTLGGFNENYLKIQSCIKEACSKNCDLIIFPESFLFGYPPKDLLEWEFLIEEQYQYIKKIKKYLPEDISVLVGAITPTNKKRGNKFFNSAVLMRRKKRIRFFHKELLPSYDVFNESRHFSKGRLKNNRVNICGKKVLISICEDIWGWRSPKHSPYLKNPLKFWRGADLVINMSSSPFSYDKIKLRETMIKNTAEHFNAPLIFVNMVGGQDELIFDGGSLVANSNGQIIHQCPRFKESLDVIDPFKESFLKSDINSNIDINSQPEKPDFKKIRDALILGIKDFLRKNNIKKVHLGLSGGIDSALVACLATEALGSENVTAIALPGPYSSKKSLVLAEELAKNLRISFLKLDITNSYENLCGDLYKSYGEFEFGKVNENLQARIRALALMSYANLHNSLLLNTGNKSEFATGYITLYGDSCGGLAPIGDLLKTQVYEVCKLYKTIPIGIVERPPSAELRPNQKDEDSLPPYKELDQSIENIIIKKEMGESPLDKRVFSMILGSEFKRWQAPPILKISPRSFGKDFNHPISVSSKFKILKD